MKIVRFFFLLLGMSLVLSVPTFAKTTTTEVETIQADPTENESFFYRVARSQLVSVIYEDILGSNLGTMFQWLHAFSTEELTNFSPNDYWILDNNQSGGFEIYDEEFNYISIAPDLQRNYSLISSQGNWVKSRSNNFNKTYFSNEQGKEYTMTLKISFAGKKVIKDEQGYEIILNSKLNGNTEISDNEGRKLLIKYDRSGVYRLMDGKKTIMTLMIQSLQHYLLSDENGKIFDVIKRGRYNDIFIKTGNGEEILIENRFIKPIPVVANEEKKDTDK